MAASGIPDGRGEWPGGDGLADGPRQGPRTARQARDKVRPTITRPPGRSPGARPGPTSPEGPELARPRRRPGESPGEAPCGIRERTIRRDPRRAGRLPPAVHQRVDLRRPRRAGIPVLHRLRRRHRGPVGRPHDLLLPVRHEGDLLQVRILVGNTFTTTDVPRLYAFCNEWNHDRLWPKAYVHVYDDGVARVCGEVMADLKAGVAFDQLTQLIVCGIETGLHMADAVAELQDA